jgi:hypothetical protein
LTEALIEAGDDGAPRDVQVRRVGALHLRLDSSSSQGAAGVRVELEAQEGGGKLSSWLERGLVQVEGGAPLSDANGMLRVSGLPHGEYQVRLSSTSGTWVAGRVKVNPGAPTSAVLAIP